jgi:H+/Cl- antiporter ClcA
LGRVALIRFFFGGGNISMLHLLWYIIVGLIAGFVAKSVMHLHMTHLFDRPKPEANYHPAGIIVSILFALLVLWVLSKFPIFSADQI